MLKKISVALALGLIFSLPTAKADASAIFNPVPLGPPVGINCSVINIYPWVVCTFYPG